MTFDPEEFPSSNTIYGIPRSHWTCHLYNFEEPSEVLVDSIREFIRGWKEQDSPAPHLLLTGKPGNGKSHLAVGLYRHAVYESDLTEATFLYVPEFVKKVKATYDKSSDVHESDLYAEVEEASLLILDDIFGSELSSHEINKILTNLIGVAYNKNQSLVVTTNYSKKELHDYLHPHEMSRLLNNCKVLNFNKKDRRLK